RIPSEAEDQGVHTSRAAFLSDQRSALICLRRRSAPHTGRWSKRLICDLNLRSAEGNFLFGEGKRHRTVCIILPISFTPSLFSPPLPHTPLFSPLNPPPPNPSPITKMDLHRAAFKMESSSYLPNPLASPALMVLASTAEASRDASIPCQQPRPFGVPVSVEKDIHLPFNNGSYTFASMYHRQGAVPPGFPNRDFPPSLLHLHHQFAPPNLDCSPISMLNHSGVGAFRPFASPPEDRDGAGGGYQSAFTPAKRLKGCLEADASPHLRYSDAEGKEYDFGGSQIPSSSPSALKAVEDAGKKIFALSGLLSDRETSSSPEDRIERCEYPFTFIQSVLLRLTDWSR
ncbi:putative E3 ubiquitin-protein ligase Rnf220-like, partial [Triplophysa rosa]